MRVLLATGALGLIAIAACGDDDESKFDGGASSGASGGTSGTSCTGFGGCTYPDGGKPGCVGIQCNQVDCPENSPKTTLTGKVYDPAGKVPIYNVTVYVPNAELPPLSSGVSCDRCSDTNLANPIAVTHTDATGSFTLPDIPANTDFPLVMQIGKWRKKVMIPKVANCQSATADATLTRLPKNHQNGDSIPQIALATGSADPLECLLRKIGIDDSEFGVAGSDARVHLFKGGSTDVSGTPEVETATASLKAGGALTDATTLWGTADALSKYDVVLLSCEGGEHADTKPVTARQALYDYATKGGRIFTSHYHHYWFSNSPVPEVKGIATWANDFTCTSGTCPPIIPEPAPDVIVNATVNTSFAKGQALHDWLQNTSSLTGPNGTLPIQEMRDNVSATGTGGISWMTVNNPATGANNALAHEYVSFNAPIGASDENVCGRVVYTDLHVGAGDKTGPAFPDGCVTTDLTPQQKALEFMLFDLSSCVQRDDQPPVK
jgi:hypothetical protein